MGHLDKDFLKKSIDFNRIFHKWTTLATMPILVSEILLYENKNFQWQNITADDCPYDLWFKVQHIPFWPNRDVWVRISRPWLYKEPQFSILQANSKLDQKREWFISNQRSRVKSSLWVTFCYWIFFSPRSKASDANKLALLPVLFSLDSTNYLISTFSELPNQFASLGLSFN